MKSNPHCYYSTILFQLSTQLFRSSFTPSSLALSGALGIRAWACHVPTPPPGQVPGAKAWWEPAQPLHSQPRLGGVIAGPLWGEVGG